MNKNIEIFIKEYHGWHFPINPVKICEKLNVKVEYIHLPEYIKGYYSRENSSIRINSALNRQTQRFIIAREIQQVSLPNLRSDYKKNSFAQELLMPADEFIKVWSDSIPVQVKQCSRYFDVSAESVIIRAKSLYRKGLLDDFTYGLFTDIFKEVKTKKGK